MKRTMPSALIRDVGTAYEMAHAAHEVQIGDGWFKTTRAMRRARAVEARIAAASAEQQNPRVRRLYEGVAAVALHDGDVAASEEVRRLATMPGHEIYKYEPQTMRGGIARRFARVLHEAGESRKPRPVYQYENTAAEPLASHVHAVHETLGTTEARQSDFVGWPTRQSYVKTETPHGFMVEESYNPGSGGNVELNRAAGAIVWYPVAAMYIHIR